jgi:hypothetical protein
MLIAPDRNRFLTALSGGQSVAQTDSNRARSSQSRGSRTAVGRGLAVDLERGRHGEAALTRRRLVTVLPGGAFGFGP